MEGEREGLLNTDCREQKGEEVENMGSLRVSRKELVLTGTWGLGVIGQVQPKKRLERKVPCLPPTSSCC